MRAAAQVTKQIVNKVSTMLSAICQAGGVKTVIRKNIRSGVAIGNSESASAMGLSGLRSTNGKKTMLRISGDRTGNARLCASWIVFTAAPIAAYMDAYRK